MLARDLSRAHPLPVPQSGFQRGDRHLRKLVRLQAALAAFVIMGACAPVSEPIIAPVPEGPAGDTAARPQVQRVPVSSEFQGAVQRGTRTATGQPGPRYWQQRVRYAIDAELDPRTTELRGRERIVYWNNSPDSLRVMAVNLYQNLFRQAAAPNGPLGINLTRAAFRGQNLPTLTRAQAEANLARVASTPGVVPEGTLGRIYLPAAIAPGDSATFEFEWNYRVPPTGAPRTGFEDALGGRVLQVAQWYPQLAVYDDVVGMDVTRYSGQGEFYLDYGDFEYSLTLPSGWLVGGTGTLANPEQVLTPEVRQRLARALQTDSIVRVVTPGDVGRGTLGGTSGRVTWRFTAQNVRDVAFATSDRYLWDATRAVIPGPNGGTRTVAVHSLYRPGAPGWEESARHGQHSMAYLSRQIIPYLYPQITVSEGPVYGMEYPMLVFIGRPTNVPEGLYEVIAHEVGHEWFPMMVGQDEAAFPWMDEGFTTYHEALAFNDFFPRQDHWEQSRDAYLAAAGRKLESPLMRSADVMDDPQMGVAAYFKPGTLLHSLRVMLGEEVFDRAMRTYANEWLLKHPYPWDFFNTVERVAGRDLDWFWHPWWFTTATLDLAVAGVTPAAGSVTVTVRDVGQAVAPAIVVVTTRDGRTTTQTIPAEAWLQPRNTRVATVTIPVQGDVTRVEIDPQQLFPEPNRRNNVWTAR